MAAAWRFIHSGACSPAENMAIDEAILLAVSAGEAPPTVRFYEWSPAALSIGYFQKASAEVDLGALREEGLGFVRRPTGGRAVLHDRELTYSIVVPEQYPGIPQSVTEAYRVLSEGLLLGFRSLGLDARMVQLVSEEEKAKYESMGSAACFDSPSWYELVVEGRKVAGSAQTRQKDVVLQHGSILLDMDTEQLFRVLKFSSDRLRDKLKEQFVKRAVAINDLLRAQRKPPVALRQVEEAFRAGIAQAMDITLTEAELSGFERELARRLIGEKYGSEEWNLRR